MKIFKSPEIYIKIYKIPEVFYPSETTGVGDEKFRELLMTEFTFLSSEKSGRLFMSPAQHLKNSGL